MGLLRVVFAVLLPAPVVAAPQLFGRRPKKEDKTRLLTGKVIDGGDGLTGRKRSVYLTNTHDHSVKTYIVGPEGTLTLPGAPTDH